METSLTPSIVMMFVGIVGTIFGVYKHFKDPQIDSEMTDALMSQQFKHYTEATERRFIDIQENFRGLLLQNNNHIHTLDTKVDKAHSSIDEMGKQIVKLGTIIEERIPRK